MSDQPPTADLLAELPPLTPWQQHLTDALLRGAVVSMPRQNGRRAIADHIARLIGTAEAPAAPIESDLVVTSRPVCENGCCVLSYDALLGRPTRDLADGQWVRPMFEVLPDNGQYGYELDDDSVGVMRIDAAEYDRPDRVFL